MTRRWLTLATLGSLGALLAQSASADSRAAGPYCHAADGKSVSLIADVLRIVTLTDSASAAGRELLHLTATDSSSVSLVTDETTCQQVVQALNTYTDSLGGTGTWSTIYLIRAGSQFAATEADSVRGTSGFIFMDSLYHVLSMTVTP